MLKFICNCKKSSLTLLDDFKIDFIIPKHTVKLRKRGFNQPLIIADVITNRYGISMNDCINRTKWTKSQTKLNIHERKKNTENAFFLKSKIIADKVLLIDDILIIGVTANSCSRALKPSNICWTNLFTLGST